MVACLLCKRNVCICHRGFIACVFHVNPGMQCTFKGMMGGLEDKNEKGKNNSCNKLETRINKEETRKRQTFRKITGKP